MTATVHGAFADVARAAPRRTAIVHGSRTVDYATLHRWSGHVAAGLRGGLEPEEAVGLCTGRSPSAVAAMLGIWRSGGAYVPLDPQLPDARLSFIVEDSGLRRVLADSGQAARLRSLLPDSVEVSVVPDAPEDTSAPDDPDGAPQTAGAAEGAGTSLAYVLYTSGSTGQPKGVLIEHRGVVERVRDPLFGVTEDDVFCQLAPLHADPSVFEIWAPLLAGATLVVPPQGELSVHEIGAEVARHRVSVLRLVAPLFALMVDTDVAALRGLRLLISGGDRAVPSAVRRALAELPGCTVLNGYGPTEATVYACCHPMRSPEDFRESWTSVPVGAPVGGVTAYVLDSRLEPSGSGELYLAGTGLARGYLNRPALDAERFPAHPSTGERMYRTGDRVRILPDGGLEFLGRLDDQVKVRGFRVELAEVEIALTDEESVEEAVVVSRSGTLEAYVRLRAGHGGGPGPLRSALAERLPDYMVPTSVTAVAAFPLLPNGKIDRQALRTEGASGDRPYRAPGTASERLVAQVWSRVLGQERIGADDSFFALGGHSLAAMEIVAVLARENGHHLPLAALFEAPTVAAFAERLDAAVRHRSAGAPAPAPAPAEDGVPEDGFPESGVPLLPGQEGIWFEDQLGRPERYTIARTFDVQGQLDVSALRTALAALADRHSVLKSVVVKERGGLRQTVRAQAAPELRVADLAADDVPLPEREARARELADRATSRPVDLAEGPLMRMLAVAVEPDRWVLHLTVHHIIADDWSLDILFEELSSLYASARSGTPSRLPPLPTRYADFVTHEQEQRRDRVEQALSDRQSALSGYDGPFELPADHPRPEVLSGAGDRIVLQLDGELTRSLGRVARENDVSRFMFALASVYLLLSRYTGQDDLCLGTPAAGRGRPGSESLIGYFVNMLAVRLDPKSHAELTPRGLLASVRESCLSAYRHQDVSYHDLLRELPGTNPLSPAQLFQVVVAHQQRPARPLRLSGTRVAAREHEGSGTAKFELGFGFQEHEEGMRVEIEFSTDLFRKESVERMAEHLVNVVRWLVEHPDTPVSELSMLSPREEHLVRVEWNRTRRDFPDGCLHELLSRQAPERYGKTAVVGPDETLTYGQLEERSDRLARELIRSGLAPEDRVLVCLERSARLTVAILAVLKAGGVYVPLDPSYPAERLRLIAADAKAEILLTTDRLGRSRFDAAALAALTVIDMTREPETDTDPLGSAPFEPPRRPGPDDLAYIIYTSGSTGTPRGVAVEHRSLVSLLDGHRELCGFQESDVWSQFAASGFDMAVYEQLMPLLTGATSIVCPDEVRLDGREFIDFVNRHRITVMVTAPAFLQSLGQPELPSVRWILTGGEAAHMPDVKHYAPAKNYLNGYGPTETVVIATSHIADGTETGPRLPIGRPLANTRIYVLDHYGLPAPVGVPGEVYIAGTGLARGYWGDPELTAEKFVTVPSLGEKRLYRTGDRARWLPDGTLDFLGRLNQQIKLRGYRIELGEIETVLAGHPAVSHAAVVAHQQSLVAFVVSDADPARLRAYLAERLPGYMVPGLVRSLERIPRTAHDKVDRRALTRLLDDGARTAPGGGASPERAHGHGHRRGAQDHGRDRDRDPDPDPGRRQPQGQDRAAAPATATEQDVAALWKDVLGEQEAGADADFFALGGHSLLVVSMLEQVEARFAVRIGVRDFLAAPTVRGLAALIDDGPGSRTGTGTGAGAGTDGKPVPASEAVLEPASFPAPRWPASSPRTVLLTGATGFVGAFLLRELLRVTRAQVLCLVRAPSAEAARDRLCDAAERYRLGIDPHDPRVVPVPGDLGAPGLGLDPALRATLAGTVEAIVHNGAHVHHLSPYSRLRAANVEGTRELLALASEGCPSRFHHVSSLSVFTEAEGRVVREDTPTQDEAHTPGRGYSASKWVAERLVTQALERGLHGRVFRLGRVSGDSEQGVASVDDMFYRLLLSCVALRCFPADDALRTSLLPVDVTARAMVALALDGSGGQAVHHVHHHQHTGLAEFMAAFDELYGTRTPAVPLAEWLDRARAADDAGRQLAVQPYRRSLEELAVTDTGRPPVTYANEATRAVLSGLDVPIPPVDAALIRRYWRYLEAEGHLT